MPVEHRTTIGSASRQPYGAPADIIGRVQSGWQTNSGSLVFDARWIDMWHDIAESGPGHGKKNHDSVPFNRRSQKNGWPVPTAKELAVVLHLVRRVDPSGIAEEYPWCHGLQRAENIQRNDAQRPSGDRQAIFRTLNHWGMQYDLHPSSSAASDREMAL